MPTAQPGPAESDDPRAPDAPTGDGWGELGWKARGDVMDIRDLSDADRASAVALWHECGLTRPWNDPDADFDRALAGPSSSVLGAFEGSELRSTVMVGHDGHRGWVYYLAVDPDHRGRGHGRLMVGAAEAWLRAKGIPKLNLMVRSDNAAVVAFYERLEFESLDVSVLTRWLPPIMP